jgi:hypothetical protein
VRRGAKITPTAMRVTMPVSFSQREQVALPDREVQSKSAGGMVLKCTTQFDANRLFLVSAK